MDIGDTQNKTGQVNRFLVQTSRFGQLDVAEDEILQFSEGLLGFSQLKKFVLVDDPNDEIFAWLQSCDSAEIAFPVLEPQLFVSQYSLDLSKTDLEALQLTDMNFGRCLTIVTIPVDPTQMTANMKAPIVINLQNKWARQCVLQDNNLMIREPIFTKLRQRVVLNPGASFKAPAHDMGAIRVPRPIATPEVDL